MEILQGRITKECSKILTARMDGTRKRGRPRDDKTDEVEGDLKTLRIISWHEVAGDGKEWMGIVLDAKVHNGLECLSRRE